MEFRKEVTALLDQIPAGRIARFADLARGLGDIRAAPALFRFLREHPDLPGADRVVTQRVRPGRPPTLERERWTVAITAPYFRDFRSDAPLARLREEQRAMAAKVSRRNGFRSLRTVGGIDMAYEDDRGFASLVVLRLPDLAVIEEAYAARDVDFPYIPTYLAYREWPLIEAAFAELRQPPSVLLVDGHGRLHPARCGIACMVGVRLDVPTIGVAKNPLVGTVDRRPKRGEAVPVRFENEVLGYAVRTGSSIRPIFVSTGHRVDLRSAVRIVRDLCRTRHPEPLRLAHIRAAEWKRRQGKKSKWVRGSLPAPRAGIPKAQRRRA